MSANSISSTKVQDWFVFRSWWLDLLWGRNRTTEAAFNAIAERISDPKHLRLEKNSFRRPYKWMTCNATYGQLKPFIMRTAVWILLPKAARARPRHDLESSPRKMRSPSIIFVVAAAPLRNNCCNNSLPSFSTFSQTPGYCNPFTVLSVGT